MERSGGFTLIEMAVVVVIIAALLTLGLGALNAQLSSASYTTTKQRQAAIKDALIAYLGANKRFPCPYVPGAGTPVAGNDPTTPPDSTPPASSTTPTCSPALGIVPFATLRIGREVAQDGWGNFFSYQVFAQPTPVCPGVGIDWGNSNCFGAGKINSSFTVNDGTVSASTELAANVVAVVISHGPNGLGAWGAQGTRNAAPTTCEEFNNAVGIPSPPPPGCTPTPNVFYKGERQDRDDVVAYLVATDAINALSKQGTINSANAQVNIDLQTLYDQTLWIKRNGMKITGTTVGPGTISVPIIDCSNPVANSPSAPIDPWGNKYVVGEQAGSGTFQICICSSNSVTPSSLVMNSCPSTTSTAVCKNIDKPSFNSYLFKSGWPGCP